VDEEQPTALRIGELARRVGASPELLRAWERRYGVLRPRRSPSGYRLYGREDERRARRMRELIAQGMAAAEAAAAVSGTEPSTPAAAAHDLPGDLPRLAGRLQAALLAFDAPVAHGALDRLLADQPLDAVLRDAVLPALRTVGDGWADGTVSIAQEHFSSELLGSRLRALARGWETGSGRHAVLACPAGERHDLGLLCHGLALRERGWRVSYLGADTPLPAVTETVRATRPDVLILGVLRPELLGPSTALLAELADEVPIAIGGAGARPDLAARAHARHLDADPVTAADLL
jgi:DNA-binding transcriptional MerR regulator